MEVPCTDTQSCTNHVVCLGQIDRGKEKTCIPKTDSTGKICTPCCRGQTVFTSTGWTNSMPAHGPCLRLHDSGADGGGFQHTKTQLRLHQQNRTAKDTGREGVSDPGRNPRSGGQRQGKAAPSLFTIGDRIGPACRCQTDNEMQESGIPRPFPLPEAPCTKNYTTHGVLVRTGTSQSRTMDCTYSTGVPWHQISMCSLRKIPYLSRKP